MADAAPVWAVVGRSRSIDGQDYRIRVSSATRVRVSLPGSHREIYVKQIVHENDTVWLYQILTRTDLDGDPIAWTRTIDTLSPPDHLLYKEVWRIFLSIDDRLLTLSYPADLHDGFDLPFCVFQAAAAMLLDRSFISKLNSVERIDA